MKGQQMNIDLSAAIRKAAEFRCPRPMVSDESVQAKIYRMADLCGYSPSEQIIEPVRAYLSGYGIILSGDAGIGKTFLMRSLGARLYGADGIAEYGLRFIGNWYDWTDEKDICIDDLGAEGIVSEYGAKDDVLKIVLAHRAERQNGRTSITTNLSSEQIAARYGDRTLSRILGMCKPFAMTGTSQRKARQYNAHRIFHAGQNVELTLRGEDDDRTK